MTQHKITADQLDLTSVVPLSGDHMTGPLYLSGDPTVPLGAATKQYVDSLSGSSPVIYDQQVWVEAGGDDNTGRPGRRDLPFATIDAALDGSNGATIIHIGVGAFAMPTCDVDLGNTGVVNPNSKLRANLWFKGSMVPVLDDYTTPTRLINGTVLYNGEFAVNGSAARNGFRMTDLGIDNGSFHTSSDMDGFAVFNIGQVNGQAPLHGIVIDNVITLCRSTNSAVHGFCFENCVDPQVTRIQSYNGWHGLAWKCVGGYVNGAALYGHHADLVIIKESNFGNTSAPCNNTILTNIVGGCLTPGDTNVGLWFETPGPNDLFNITVTNMTIKSAMAVTDINFIIDGGEAGSMRKIRIDNLQTTNVTPTHTLTSAGSGAPIDQASIFINGTPLAGGGGGGSASTTSFGPYSARPTASAIGAGNVYSATDTLENYYSDGTTYTVLPGGGTETGYCEITSNQTVTSSTTVAVPGMLLTFVAGERPFMLSVVGEVQGNNSNVWAGFSIEIGTSIGNVTQRMVGDVTGTVAPSAAAGIWSAPVHLEQRFSGFTPGTTYTVVMKVASLGSGGTVTLNGSSVGRFFMQTRTL